jgi:hypothetical protein
MTSRLYWTRAPSELSGGTACSLTSGSVVTASLQQLSVETRISGPFPALISDKMAHSTQSRLDFKADKY